MKITSTVYPVTPMNVRDANSRPLGSRMWSTGDSCWSMLLLTRAGFSLNRALFRKKCGAPNISIGLHEYCNRFYSNLVARLHILKWFSAGFRKKLLPSYRGTLFVRPLFGRTYWTCLSPPILLTVLGYIHRCRLLLSITGGRLSLGDGAGRAVAKFCKSRVWDKIPEVSTLIFKYTPMSLK